MINKKKLQGILIKYWDAGYSKVLGRFYGMINFILIASTFLLIQGINIDLFVSVALFFGMIVFVFILGIIYVKFGFLGAEQTALYQENPEFMALRKDIYELREIIDVIKQKE